MKQYKAILAALFVFIMIDGYGQKEPRINEIRQLYKDYNEKLPNMDSFEIKYNTAGSYPSLIIYTDYSGKVLIKTKDEDEFSATSSEYYFKNDTIQFIFNKTDKLLSHWGEDSVRFSKLELRFYFENGKVIKALKKNFVGIDPQNKKIDLESIKNSEIDYLTDSDANWKYYSSKYKDLIKLYLNLKNTF